LDGRFGLADGSDLRDPLSGGLAGLVKTARHEWPGVACRALDLADDFGTTAAEAAAIATELFHVAPVEVGLAAGGSMTLDLMPAPFSGPLPPSPLASGDLVLVSGGARGVTAEVAVALAGSRPTLVLLGRSAAPVPEPDWLVNLTDEAAIKKGLLERAVPGTKPKQLEEEYRNLSANREMLRNLARIEASGAVCLYRSVDIRDARSTAAIIGALRAEFGPVRGIIHGAGVLADRLIVDKSPEQFEMVYGTKVTGLRNLLSPLEGDELRFLTLFSSSTGRFGRSGQVAYAVANEALNKLAHREARRRPGCRVTAINWGPWDGGMVTPALKKLFAGEGVEVIGLQAGSDTLLREIALPPGGGVETVILGRGAETNAAETPVPPAVEGLAEAVVLELSVDKYPFLSSHVMNGRAVLPLAMVAEWLAHGALHGNPGLRFHGFDDLRIFKGVTFAAGTPCTVRVMAGKAGKRDSFHVVPVELRSGTGALHARGEVILAARLPEGLRTIAVADLATGPYPHGTDELYREGRLFHGPVFQGIERVTGCGPGGIVADVMAAPSPSRWIAAPLRNDWLTDPLALDSSFQMMILWSLERFGAGSLPTAIGRYRQFQGQFPREGTEIVIRIVGESSHSARAVMEFLDRQSGKLVARLEGYECVIDASLRDAFRKNHLVVETPRERGAA
jgi:NAD(P)-dependent dehydrogenase (short-subunit alcohol dehydrogenase family)